MDLKTPKRAKGKQYAVEISAVAWIDLLGYGSMLRKVAFNPSHKDAQAAISRLRCFQATAASHAMRHLRALIVNDGVAYVRELSPRARSVSFDFIRRVHDAHQQVNALDQAAGYPGARMVVAVGPRLRMRGSTVYNQAHLASIISRFKKNTLSPEQAILEAFRSTPLAGSSVPLQANFAFTKAYLADQEGSKAGFHGAKMFLDKNFFSRKPQWLHSDRLVAWSTQGMNGQFFQICSIDSVQAGREQYADVRDAEEIANAIGVDYGLGQRASSRIYSGQ